MSTDFSALGQAVEPAQIRGALKKLWDANGTVNTRASLINFAVYCDGPAALVANTVELAEFTRHHACRALLVACDATAPDSVQAWINAHCHIPRAGAKHVCCEQISFLLGGAARDRLGNILLGNLDSDLPLVVWWRAPLPPEPEQSLWSRVDRMIYDSQTWAQPRQEFRHLREHIAAHNPRLILCDLNWTRSLRIRQAAAQMFDFPDNLRVLADLRRVRISHTPEYRSTALLLVGWLAAQLKLTLISAASGVIALKAADGREIAVELRAEAGRSISECSLFSENEAMEITRDTQGDFFRVEVRLGDGRHYRHLLPAGTNVTAALLLEELGIVGQHRVYMKALSFVEELL